LTNLFKNLKPDFFKDILKTGIDYFYINLVDRLVAFFSFLLLARAFDSHLYGKIVTVFAVSTIVMTVFDFGLPIYAQRESAKKESLQDTFDELYPVKVLSIILYIVLLPVIAFSFYKDIPPGIIAIIGGIILLQNISNLFSFVYYGKDESRFVLKTNVISKIFFIVIISVSFLFYRNIYFFLAGYIVAYLYSGVVLSLKLSQFNIKVKLFELTFKKLRSTLLIILPLGIASALNLVYDKIDIVILSAYLDYDKIAQYSVAYTIYRLSGIVFSIILFPALNQFSRLADDLHQNIRLLFRYLVTSCLVSVILILIYIYVVSELIPILFGPEYLEASRVIIPLSFAIFLWSLNAIIGVYLNGLGLFKEVMIASVSGMIINIIINIILIPKIGILGAVYTTIITEFLIFMVEIIFVFFNYKKNVSI